MPPLTSRTVHHASKRPDARWRHPTDLRCLQKICLKEDLMKQLHSGPALTHQPFKLKVEAHLIKKSDVNCLRIQASLCNQKKNKGVASWHLQRFCQQFAWYLKLTITEQAFDHNMKYFTLYVRLDRKFHFTRFVLPVECQKRCAGRPMNLKFYTFPWNV